MSTSVDRSFDKKLYVLAAVEEALEVYADFGSLEIDNSGDAWTVSFAEVVEGLEADTLADEFANHVLAGTVERNR